MAGQTKKEADYILDDGLDFSLKHQRRWEMEFPGMRTVFVPVNAQGTSARDGGAIADYRAMGYRVVDLDSMDDEKRYWLLPHDGALMVCPEERWRERLEHEARISNTPTETEQEVGI